MRLSAAKVGQVGAVIALLSAAANAIPQTNPPQPGRRNDYNCRSTVHPNPVVLIHGLFANEYDDLSALEYYLQGQGFCAFSLTYGQYQEFPFVGGLKPIATSAPDISAFIRNVKTKTGAAKVDIVGHSEGGFQTLYVPKFQGIASIAQTLVAIAPPSHGTTVSGLYTLGELLGNLTQQQVEDILSEVGCGACSDLTPNGGAVKRLNDGKPIVQSGNKLTVIASRNDKIVTPVTTAFVNETGVRNLYVQDYCPQDQAGHVGLAFDTNVYNLVVNALQNTPTRKFSCSAGGFPS